jgi:hypothetical protein
MLECPQPPIKRAFGRFTRHTQHVSSFAAASVASRWNADDGG